MTFPHLKYKNVKFVRHLNFNQKHEDTMCDILRHQAQAIFLTVST